MAKLRMVPADAQKILYKAGKHKGTFWYWQNQSGKWFWQALSNNGEETTKEQAIERAKRWIKDRQ